MTEIVKLELAGRVRACRGEAMGIELAPNGKTIMTAGFDGVIRWDAKTLKQEHVFFADYPHTACQGVAVSGNGKTLIAAVGFATHVWDFKTGELLGKLETSQGHATSVGISKTGRIAATGKPDQLHIWNVSKMTEIPCQGLKGSKTWQMAVAPDGKHVVSGSMKSLAVYDAKTGRVVAETSGLPGRLNRLRFLPDSRHVVVCCSGTDVHIWDIVGGQIVQSLSGHKKSITCAAVTKDGRLLATGSGDRTARLWDLASGETLAVTGRHDHAVAGVAVTGNGESLATIDLTDLHLWKG